MNPKIYEYCLQGFNGSTSDTDHLVKWIKAFSAEDVMQFINCNHFQIVGDVNDITDNGKETWWYEQAMDYDLTNFQQ